MTMMGDNVEWVGVKPKPTYAAGYQIKVRYCLHPAEWESLCALKLKYKREDHYYNQSFQFDAPSDDEARQAYWSYKGELRGADVLLVRRIALYTLTGHILEEWDNPEIVRQLLGSYAQAGEKL